MRDELLAEATDVLARAKEELRLLREKDTGEVYDPALRGDLSDLVIRLRKELAKKARPADEPDAWVMSKESTYSIVAYGNEARELHERDGFEVKHPVWLSPVDLGRFCTLPIDDDGHLVLRRLRDFLHARNASAGVMMEYDVTLDVRDELAALLGEPQPEKYDE